MRVLKERLNDESRSRDAGDTLVEVLLTLVVLALCGLALIAAFGTSISSSAEYQRLATVDTVLRSVEESAVAQIQQQASADYIPCGTDAQYTTEFGGTTAAVSAQLGVPAGFAVTFTPDTSSTDVEAWDSSSGQFVACTSQLMSAPQLITLTVTQTQKAAPEVDSASFIVDDRSKPSTQGTLSANPSVIGFGAQSVPVTITGQGFNNGTDSGGHNDLAVSVNCGGVSTGPATYNSSSSVSVKITVASPALTSNYCAVTVTNGDGTSVTDYNVIYIDPAPSIVSATPVAAGTTGGNVTVTGANFVPGGSLSATIDCLPFAVTQTKYLSSTQLLLTVTVPSSTPTPQQCGVGVVNGDEGQGFTASVLTITAFETPTVNISSPSNGDFTNQTAPTFVGTATAADLPTITVTIYSGGTATGTPVQTLTTTQTSGAWSVTPSSALPGNAEYSAVATQKNSSGTTGISPTNTFVIDTTKPVVTINSPYVIQDSGTGTYYGNNTAPTITGTGGTLAASQTTGVSQDQPPISVTITTGGTVFETLGATTLSGGTWSVPATTLSQGQEYTAQATQHDEAGNVGTSSAVTFVVDTVPPVVSNITVTPSIKGTKHKFSVTFNGGILADSTTTSADLTTGTVYACTSAQYTANSNSCVSNSNWTAKVTATLTTGTTFSTGTATTIAAGSYYFTVVQSDSVGNTSIPVSTSSTIAI